MESFGWAFIGAGGITRTVAKQIFKSGRHSLKTVYNRTKSKAEKLTRKYGGKACDTLQEALAMPEVEGVYVATSNNRHCDDVLAALDAGKCVLTEKLFAVNARQAQQMINRAEQKQLYLAEAMWTWFSPLTNKIRGIVQSGGLGDIKDCFMSLCLPIAHSKKSRLLNPNAGGGALLDLGVYPVTYAYKLFGKPNAIDCRAKLKGGVDIHDDIIMYYDTFRVDIPISIKSPRCGSVEKLKIRGCKGSLTASGYHAAKRFTLKNQSGRQTFLSGKNARLMLFDSAAAEIREGKKQSAFVTLDDSLQVMKLLDECRDCIKLKFPCE